MFQTLIGLILLLTPFLLLFCFKNKTAGFLYITLFSTLAHSFISIITQSLHIFNYQIIITITTILALASLIFFIKKKCPISTIHLSIFVVIGFTVIFFQLYSVHHYFTGTISTVSKSVEVKNYSYPYPYFSDEWVGVSFSKYSIETQSLPLVNPLYHDKKFPNIMLPFFSFVSEIFLILNLDPLTNYRSLSLVAGIFICFLIYQILRTRNIDDRISIITALSVPYLVNSANLPGIWYFLPYTLGSIFLLISLIGNNIKNNLITISSAILATVFYPPIIIFTLPYLLYLFIKSDYDKKTKKIALIILISLSTISIICIFLLKNTILNYVFRTNLENGIPNFLPWFVMPVWLFILSIIGLVKSFGEKNKDLLYPTIVGFVFWFFYTLTTNVFIIDYPRVVTITSLFLIIFAGLGLNFIYQNIIKRYPVLDNKKSKNIFITIVLIFFILSSFSYTESLAWRKLSLQIQTKNGTVLVLPTEPVNKYLTEEDLRIFANIENKNFLSIPWKGLVIGVATHNFPLDSKPSTITNHILSGIDFMNTDCTKKVELATKHNIDYVYLPNFSCKYFTEIASSSEKLFLYKFEK